MAISGSHTEHPRRGARGICHNWREFEDRLLERYGLDDSLQISKRELMEWVELPGKGRNTSMLLQELEKRFARLLVLDRTVVDTSKVLFIKSVDPLDRENVGVLLETYEGLTIEWALIKGVCSHFNKQCEWNDEGSSSGLTVRGVSRKCRPGRTKQKDGSTRTWLRPTLSWDHTWARHWMS